MKTALLLATARPRVVRVVDALVQNLQAHGHDPNSVSVYLSIDTAFLNTHEAEFFLNRRTLSAVNSVTYITDRRRSEIATELASKVEVSPDLMQVMLRGRGYSQQRNAALLCAITDRNDIAVFVDDDESPVLPSLDDSGALHWTVRDFWGPHFKAFESDADVTKGLILGYPSPIPTECEDVVPEDVRRQLGSVVSRGSDVIFEDSFVNLRSKIRYFGNENPPLRKRPFVVDGSIRGKGLMGGNMGLNLDSVMRKEFPLFYAPPQARGEDSFLSLQLSEQTVVEVDSSIFHDPFDLYPSILEGNYPDRLDPISITPAHVERFCSALVGWLKYAPLFIKMTSTSEIERSARIESMLEGIKEPTDQMAHFLRHENFKTCHEALCSHARLTEQHFSELQQLQAAWRDRIKSSVLA